MIYYTNSRKELIAMMSSAILSKNSIIKYNLQELSCELKFPQYNIITEEPWIIGMKRVGKSGTPIFVYKMRTMYSGSRHLQGYLMAKNGLINGDKISNDFRHTKLSRFLRRSFLDELPMVINLIKGDIKLIGVRVISEKKFSVLNTRLQELRLQVKPALIPIYYCYVRIDSLDMYQEYETKYIQEYKTNPVRTDLKYFVKFILNTLFYRPLNRIKTVQHG